MARSFNGTSDGASVGTHAVLAPAAISQSVWIKPVVPNSNYGCFLNQVGVSFLAFSGTTAHLAYYYKDGSSIFIDPGSITLVNGAWAHVCATYDSVGGLKTYVNGVSDGTVAASGTSVTTPGNFTIGKAVGNFYSGSMADAAQWSVALTAGEVSALVRGVRPNKIRPTSLVAWWPLDGLQSPEPDLSGNADNATLTGTALASGPPIALFTSRWPQFTPSTNPPFMIFTQQTLAIPLQTTVNVTLGVHS